MAQRVKDKRIKGLAGFLDTRSQPDETGLDAFRVVLNASIRGRNKRCRRGGWKKFYSGVNTNYNNEDLHDQLLGLSFYYEGLSKDFTTPSQFTGYVYPYFSPGVDVESRVDVSFVDTICGYAPDWEGVYDYPPFDGYGIQEGYFVGYPYIIDHADYPYDDPCVGPYPDYWAYSFFRLLYATYVEGEYSAAYEFGDPQAVFTQATAYTYEYCGNYPYYYTTCNEHVTMLDSIGSADGSRTLVAGTKSRLYALNQSLGNWKIIADGLGSDLDIARDCDDCPLERWQSAKLDNVMVLTNNFNPVMAYNPISSPTTCNVWRATAITDLQTLNILTAAVVGSWKGFVFIADVYQDGARRRNRIAWCDYNDPYTWIPADDNLAGFQDLGNDETILRVEGLNDYLFIYTDKSIYRAALIQSGETTSFVFEEIYRGEEGALQYKYAFANTGDAHYYWANNRLVKFTSFDKRPQEPIILRLCSSSIYDGLTSEDLTFEALNEEACENFVGGFNPQFKEIWFSWPTGSNTCPSMSLVINITPMEEGADFVDAGFNAFHWYDGRRDSTLLEWLEDLEVCTREELLPDLVKTGQPYDTTSAAFTDPVLHIWNATEDTDLPPSDDSLCAALEDNWLRDICEKCDTLSRFVMSSASDKTLKEYADDTYSRETLEGQAYVANGYDTVLESGVSDENIDEEKLITELDLTGTAVEQTVPNTLYAYIGTGPAPDCIDWNQLRIYRDDCDELAEGIEMECLSGYTAEERSEDGIRRDDFWLFPAHHRGRYVGWRIKVNGTGGGSCFSRANLKIAKKQ